MEYGASDVHLWTPGGFICASFFICICLKKSLPNCFFLCLSALWSPAGKGLAYWFSCPWLFVVFLSLFHTMSWVRCGTWLYIFLIIASFLTLGCCPFWGNGSVVVDSLFVPVVSGVSVFGPCFAHWRSSITFKGGHLMWYMWFSFNKELLLKERICSQPLPLGANSFL